MGFFVYIHTAPNKKRYVGVTIQKPERRWNWGWGYRTNRHFHAAIKKYGWKNFTHQVFEVQSLEAMYRNEQELIELFKTTDPQYGYNKSAGGEKSAIGCKLSEETKKKISDKLKGCHRIFSEETKQKMSIVKKGRKLSEEWKRKIGEGVRGHHHTEESKRKMSDPKPKHKWLTSTGEIVEMAVQQVKQWHPDWVKIND